MKLQAKEISQLTEIAINAAKQSGAHIASALGAELDIKKKANGSSLASQVVTEIDLQSQAIILELLSPTLQAYNLALLAEESVDDQSRFEKDYFWCIDPLDGTLPFTEGKAGFSVSIALVDQSGCPWIGVVYDPYSDVLYHAVRRAGIFRNEKRWRPKVLNQKSKTTYSFVVDRSFLEEPTSEAIMEALRSIAKSEGCTNLEFMNYGGAVMNAIWTLMHPEACYFKFPKKNDRGGSLWDYAATTCIYNETKAIACDIFGHPLALNRSESTFMNHKGFIFSGSQQMAAWVRVVYERFG